jgi:hypothetical protein
MNPVYNPPESDEFRNLCIAGRGVLLQTEHLQVGIISELQTPQIALTFYYGNVTAFDIINMEISLDNPDRNSLGLEVTDASPQTLAPQQQLPHKVTFSCHREYIGVPILRVKYVFNQQEFLCSAHLPLCCTTFVQPLPLTPVDFLTAWGDVNGPPQEQIVMWKSKDLTAARVATILQQLRFQLISDVDRPENVVAATNFFSTSMKVPALCRIESDPIVQMLRVTVKSFSPTLSFSLAQLIQVHVA